LGVNYISCSYTSTFLIAVPININLISFYTYIEFLSGGVPTNMFIEVIIAIIIINTVVTFSYIILLNKKLKTVMMLTYIFTICVLATSYRYTDAIYAIFYIITISYFSAYIIKNLLNKENLYSYNTIKE